MYIEPPSSIAILGAGPIGLEAALYARYLGYEVQIFERNAVAHNVLQWGHVRMFSPFHMNSSPLGLQALAAQDESYTPPERDAMLTGSEWAEQYLLPLAKSDLLVDSLRLQTRVLGIARCNALKGDSIGDPARAEAPFRLLVEDDNRERDEFAQVVIDCTGTFGNHNWCGAGGVPAPGETATAHEIEYGLPDILGEQASRFAGKKTLLIGNGYSAATNVVALAELLGDDSKNITWITRSLDAEPIGRIADDRLASRDELASNANELVTAEVVEHHPGAIIERIAFDDQRDQFIVHVNDGDGPNEMREFDNVIANVGYRPDASLYSELQLHQCYATDGLMKLAAALLGESSADCLNQTRHGPKALMTSEPNFYILGSKSYGRNSNFLVSVGLEQIRDVFSIIGDREDLDLYATMQTAH